MIKAMITLVITGDYVPAMRPLLGEEDSPLVDLLLSVGSHY